MPKGLVLALVLTLFALAAADGEDSIAEQNHERRVLLRQQQHFRQQLLRAEHRIQRSLLRLEERKERDVERALQGLGVPDEVEEGVMEQLEQYHQQQLARVRSLQHKLRQVTRKQMRLQRRALRAEQRAPELVEPQQRRRDPDVWDI